MFQWTVAYWSGKRNGGGQDPAYVAYLPVFYGFNQASTSIWMVPGTWCHD